MKLILLLAILFQAEDVRLGFETTNPCRTIKAAGQRGKWNLIYDLPPDQMPRVYLPATKFFQGVEVEKLPGEIHLHSPEELNGGGYRNGKFVYLKELQP